MNESDRKTFKGIVKALEDQFIDGLTGRRLKELAHEWLAHGFDAKSVSSWFDIASPRAAARLRDAGLTRRQVWLVARILASEVDYDPERDACGPEDVALGQIMSGQIPFDRAVAVAERINLRIISEIDWSTICGVRSPGTMAIPSTDRSSPSMTCPRS